MGSGFTRASAEWVLPSSEPDPDPQLDRARPEPRMAQDKPSKPGQEVRVGAESALKPDRNRAQQIPSQARNRIRTTAGLSLTQKTMRD